MLPLQPSKPKKLLVLIASIMGGLMLGSSVSFVFSAVDTSFKSVDGAELALGLPVLAAVPQIQKMPEGKRFLITEEPAGAVAEAFRTLRTSLSIETGETERNTILFTSAVPSEGKSFLRDELRHLARAARAADAFDRHGSPPAHRGEDAPRLAAETRREHRAQGRIDVRGSHACRAGYPESVYPASRRPCLESGGIARRHRVEQAAEGSRRQV